MTIPVLICDDSGFARRQMARSLPDGWDIEVHFAENGEQALQKIREGKADVMFLDLNMPVMDGYQTMEQIRQQDLQTIVIVVSGDVQQEARQRMLAKGALDFIQKPIDNDKLSKILRDYGLYAGDSSNKQRLKQHAGAGRTDKLDIFREMANVAMGRAGEKLARLLGEFIQLPVPNVNLIESSELLMAISEIQRNASVSAVSKGFVGGGIRGEAIVLFSDTDNANMVQLMKYQQQDNAEQLELEAFLDVSNIIIGACLNAMSEQLHLDFSHYHPVIIGRHRELSDLMSLDTSRWSKILGIEIAYSIEKHGINFDLLLLIPGESIDIMQGRLEAAIEDHH